MNNSLLPGFNSESLSLQLIKSLEPEEGYYLAFSGGKDSIVLHHLCVRAGVKFDAHYNVTTVDPPELTRFIKRNYPSVTFEIPEFTMWELIEKKSLPPTRRFRYCCHWLKERGGSGRKVLTGVRRSESTRRSSRKVVEHCYIDSTKRVINPILEWSDTEIWLYIKRHGLEYPCLYDEGFERVGCIGCPMVRPHKMMREFERWPHYRKLYIRAFQKMIDRRREKDKPTKWIKGEEVMDWWLGEDVRELTGELLELMNKEINNG